MMASSDIIMGHDESLGTKALCGGWCGDKAYHQKELLQSHHPLYYYYYIFVHYTGTYIFGLRLSNNDERMSRLEDSACLAMVFISRAD